MEDALKKKKTAIYMFVFFCINPCFIFIHPLQIAHFIPNYLRQTQVSAKVTYNSQTLLTIYLPNREYSENYVCCIRKLTLERRLPVSK